MNRREKFDAASFILGREIRNRTITNTKNKQTLTDISTPSLSACVDNELYMYVHVKKVWLAVLDMPFAAK